MPRRGDYIRKRNDGRWEARYPIDTTNGRKYKSLYASTYYEVKQKLQNAQCGANKNDTITSQKNQLQVHAVAYDEYQQALEEVLSHDKSKNKHSSYVKYKNIYQKYILDEIPKGVIGKTGHFVISIQNTENLSPSMKRSIQTAVNKLNRVAKNKSLPIVEALVSGCVQEKKDIEIFSKEEQIKMIRYFYQNMDINKFGFMLCLSTGIRLGELCALKWSDFDLEQGLLVIERTVQRIAVENKGPKTALVISKPKSIHSERRIPLSDNILKLVKSFKTENSEYIFCKHKPLEPRTCQYRFQKLLIDVNVTVKNFHVLRHTFATNCVCNGIDIKTLSEILGHSDVRITLNRYVHPTMDAKRQHMNKLADVYGQYLGQMRSRVS